MATNSSSKYKLASMPLSHTAGQSKRTKNTGGSHCLILCQPLCGCPIEGGINSPPLKVGSSADTDNARRVPREYKEIYYSHIEAFWVEKNRNARWYGNILGQVALFSVVFWGSGQHSITAYRLQFVWFELPNWHQGREFSVFLIGSPRHHKKGKGAW